MNKIIVNAWDINLNRNRIKSSGRFLSVNTPTPPIPMCEAITADTLHIMTLAFGNLSKTRSLIFCNFFLSHMTNND